jgi:hypothetical protein
LTLDQEAAGTAQWPVAPVETRPTNALAIVALVASFFVPIAGIVCGHLALSQIRRTGEQGHGMALAGTVIGYTLTGLVVLLAFGYVLAIVVFFATVSSVTPGFATSLP